MANGIILADNIILTNEQKRLGKELGISENFLRLLLLRGHREEDIQAFLHPSLDNMRSPFELEGMQAAAERIKSAIERGERILIFGDYDCDGICAVSLLMLYLKDKANAAYFIPDRNKHGYGMTVDALENIIKTRKPDLIITVDCGITSTAEVEYLNNFGIDVIITDHHEPRESIPDCIVVDAKIKKQGFYDYCGAGVAFKLVEALGGRREAEKYIDIAAIATIADVVPLEKDNRIIAYYGLKALKSSPRKGIKMLAGGVDLTSSDVMFRLAPRLNAAGRLNNAMKVVDLFLEDDYFLLRSLSDELIRDNQRRQEICEQTVNDAKRMLRGTNFNETRIIVLESESWEAGVLGIAAARLTEEFKCPALLLSRNGDELKGSARSVPGINIFRAFFELSDYFISFGGHAQAAGVTLAADKFDGFKVKINEKLRSEYGCALPKVVCEMELDPCSDVLGFARELELLEPTGYCNPKPNFLIKGENFNFEHIGLTRHIKCSSGNMDVIGFSKFGYCIGATRGSVQLEVTLGVNEFQNTVRAQGVIRTMHVDKIKLCERDCVTLCLHHLDYEGKGELPKATGEDISSALETPFGSLIVCFDQSEYERLIKDAPIVAKLPLFVGETRYLNPENCVIIAPSPDFEFGFYSEIFVCGRPYCAGYLDHIAGECPNTRAYGEISAKKISVSDEAMRAVFKLMRDKANNRERVPSLKGLYLSVKEAIGIPEAEFYAALKLLNEAGLISVSDRGIINVTNKKTDLNEFAVYRNIRI